MVSVYSILFNAIKNNFDYQGAFKNFLSFGDEVVIVIDRLAGGVGDDGTWDAVNQWNLDNQAKLKIFEHNVSIKDPEWIGKLKNHALQHTTLPYKVLLDMDERVDAKLKERWLKYGKRLQTFKEPTYLVPSLDLYGDYNSIRWDNDCNLKFKWYLHLEGFYRGAVKQGVNSDGTINMKISDACELIDKDKNLVIGKYLIPPNIFESKALDSYLKFLKEEGIYVFHLGYVDFEQKAKINREVWGEHHKFMTGAETSFLTQAEQMYSITYSHNLPLWL
jgi:hypothetical protein